MARQKDEDLHEKRRQQILEAAGGIFRQKGFHATRTEEICLAAKLSPGSVFRYFKGMEEIIGAILEKEFERNREDIRRLVSREGLHWLAEMQGQDFARLMAPSAFELGLDTWVELYRHPKYRDRMSQEDKDLRRQLGESLRQGQEEGWLRPDLSVDGTVNLLFALFMGLQSDHQLNPHLDLGATAEALSSYIRRCLLAPS